MTADVTIPDWATHILSDHTDMERSPHPVDAARVKSFSLELPDDVYFEYAFQNAAGEVLADPENPTPAQNPWFKSASAVVGPEFGFPDLVPDDFKAAGEVKRLRLESANLHQTRRVIIYTPVGYVGEALPCLYLQDGVAYYRIAGLPAVLEVLLARGDVRPAHLVFVEPNDRTAEYRYNPAYRDFMTEELLPLVEAEVKTIGERLLMGASLGGLLSATLALHHPELFSTVVSQSGAFLGSPDELDFYKGKTSWVLEALNERPKQDLRWYVETGTLEWLTGINRAVAEVLEAKGYDYEYQERNLGHNWMNWRLGLVDALRFALAKD